MKKLIKFLVSVAAIAGMVYGALYIAKKYFAEDDEEDFDMDDFEDVFADEADDREYVTLDLEEEADKKAENSTVEETSTEENSDEE